MCARVAAAHVHRDVVGPQAQAPRHLPLARARAAHAHEKIQTREANLQSPRVTCRSPEPQYPQCTSSRTAAMPQQAQCGPRAAARAVSAARATHRRAPPGVCRLPAAASESQGPQPWRRLRRRRARPSQHPSPAVTAGATVRPRAAPAATGLAGLSPARCRLNQHPPRTSAPGEGRGGFAPPRTSALVAVPPPSGGGEGRVRTGRVLASGPPRACGRARRGPRLRQTLLVPQRVAAITEYAAQGFKRYGIPLFTQALAVSRTRRTRHRTSLARVPYSPPAAFAAGSGCVGRVTRPPSRP